MSGRLTTASEPSESGCSGSEMVEMRSSDGEVRSVRYYSCERHLRLGSMEVGCSGWAPGLEMRKEMRTVDLLLVNVLNRIILRVARQGWVVEWVGQVIVRGNEVVEKARAAIVALLHR